MSATATVVEWASASARRVPSGDQRAAPPQPVQRDVTDAAGRAAERRTEAGPAEGGQVDRREVLVERRAVPPRAGFP